MNFKRERKISESIRNSFSLLDEEKLKKRAERFGIDPDSTKVVFYNNKMIHLHFLFFFVLLLLLGSTSYKRTNEGFI